MKFNDVDGYSELQISQKVGDTQSFLYQEFTELCESNSRPDPVSLFMA